MHRELSGRGGRCSGGTSGELSPVIISKLPLSRLLPTEDIRGFDGDAGVLRRDEAVMMGGGGGGGGENG